MKTSIAAVVFLATSVATAFAQDRSFVEKPYVEITTTFDSLVTPNQIFIKIIISDQDSKGQISVEESEKNMVTALQSLGIKTETKLKKTDLTSDSQARLLRKKLGIKSEYMLEVSDANTVNNVFLKLEELGISKISINRLSHSEINKITDACRVKAIEKAKSRAVLLAKSLGQSIGPAIHIVDFDGNSRVSTFAGQIGGNSGMGAPGEEPQIEFRQLKLYATLNVKFLLK